MTISSMSNSIFGRIKCEMQMMLECLFIGEDLFSLKCRELLLAQNLLVRNARRVVKGFIFYIFYICTMCI